jgi:hypothetical protein
VPPRAIRELRDLTRQTVHVLQDRNRVKNRVEQSCQSGNSKVSSMAKDLFGVSGQGGQESLSFADSIELLANGFTFCDSRSRKCSSNRVVLLTSESLTASSKRLVWCRSLQIPR